MEDLEVQQYMKFMKFWKKKELTPKFEKINLDNGNGGSKLKCKITKLVMKVEFYRKYCMEL